MTTENDDLYKNLQETYLKYHDGHRPMSGFIRKLESIVIEQVTKAKLDEAAEIHNEGIKLLMANRAATLNQLLDVIERRHGKDMVLHVGGKHNRVEEPKQ